MSSRSTAPTAFAAALAILAVPLPCTAQNVRVTAGTIEDRRTTGKFFGGLEIELKLTGDDLADARAARVLLKKAVDESGHDLLPEQKRDEDFQKSSGSSGPNLKVNLKNPARGAGAIKEVAGDVLALPAVPRRAQDHRDEEGLFGRRGCAQRGPLEG